MNLFKKRIVSFFLVGQLFAPLGVIAQEKETNSTVEDTVTTEENIENEGINEEGQELSDLGLLHIRQLNIIEMPEKYPKQFTYDSGVDIPYPEDGVKGIYVTGYSAAGEKMDDLIQFTNDTEINAMVIDFKDDHGNIVLETEHENEDIHNATTAYMKASEIIDQMEENQIYPIARIVVFKDTLLAQNHPEYSFTRQSDGSVWYNNGGEAFVNPYVKEVWDYNVDVAIEAAKAGFKEIQFDYVRFPEGFETFSDNLNYEIGEYGDYAEDPIGQRVASVTDFVAYAREKLQPFGVDVSVDIFGYTATIPEARGIGQNFDLISQEVDVISSMIYPSHWGDGYFGIEKPDLAPYELVDQYMEVELGRLEQLDNPPITRPWLQDFTASYLGAGNYTQYGDAEVTAQIQALNDHGVYEFLLWDASNSYSRGADFSPGD